MVIVLFQAQSDDDEVGDDVAVNVDAGGFMEQFFEQVCIQWIALVLWTIIQVNNNQIKGKGRNNMSSLKKMCVKYYSYVPRLYLQNLANAYCESYY